MSVQHAPSHLDTWSSIRTMQCHRTLVGLGDTKMTTVGAGMHVMQALLAQIV